MVTTPLTSDALRRFVETEYGRLVRAVALACGNASAAEDAVQEALARAWDRTSRGEVIDSLGAWTVTVALNHVRSGARHLAMQQRYLPRLVDHRDDDRDHAALLDLRAGLATLPRRQRETVVLHYYLGYPVAEIADVLGVSQGTVKSALHRARIALAQRLGEPIPLEEVPHADAS